MDKTIIRITTKENWLSAKKLGYYRAYDYEEEGFIHASTIEQVAETANLHYKGQSDLVLLIIAIDKVNAPIKWEYSRKRDQDFPHIYGNLNIDAVTHVVEYPLGDDGTFPVFEL